MKSTFTHKIITPIAMFLLFMASQSLLAFELQCPPDVTVDCDAELWDLSGFGNAQYHDYGGWHDAGVPVVTYHLNSCNTGYIKRKWTVFNPYDCDYVSCYQTITVQSLDFGGSFITWPKTGLELSGCNPNTSPNALPYGYQKPTWNAPSCSLLGVSYTDKVFYFGGSCKKIVRTWEVVDCCSYDPYTGYGLWTYNQEIDITVSDVPQIICPGDVYATSADCYGTYVNVPGIEIPDSECSENVVIMNDSPYATSGEDASGNYPLGTTIVTFTADYGCWQKTMCEVKVHVEDISTPTPYCAYGLAIALMGVDEDGDGIPEDGMVETWASDFDQGSYDNCNNGPLTFSFSSDVTDQSITFTCEHVGRNDLEIWVTDQDGNQNYCNTYVNIQNNAANIPDCEDNDEFSTVQGSITAHYGDKVDGLVMKAIGTSHEFEVEESIEYEIIETVIDSIVSQTGTVLYIIEFDSLEVTVYDTIHNLTYNYLDVFGEDYKFDYLAHFNDYIIQGISIDGNKDYLNMADIMAIQNYIDGVIDFNVYQKMAADVNKDGFIDDADVAFLTNLIEHGTDWFGIDDSWHFFDKSMNMENMEDDHECEEFCRIQDLKEDTYKVNLIGYRVGDVTNAKFQESDEDENETEASIIKSRSKTITEISVSPNPFVNDFQLEIDTNSPITTPFYIHDNSGAVVMTKDLVIDGGKSLIQIQNLNSLPAGIYFYSIQLGDQLKHGKLVKIN